MRSHIIERQAGGAEVRRQLSTLELTLRRPTRRVVARHGKLAAEPIDNRLHRDATTGTRAHDRVGRAVALQVRAGPHVRPSLTTRRNGRRRVGRRAVGRLTVVLHHAVKPDLRKSRTGLRAAAAPRCEACSARVVGLDDLFHRERDGLAWVKGLERWLVDVALQVRRAGGARRLVADVGA